MRRLFWASLAILIFTSCQSALISENDILLRARESNGLEAVSIYSSYNSDSAKVLYNLAYSYLQADDYANALITADKALSQYPDSIRFLKLKAYCYKSLSDIPAYEEQLEYIVSILPGAVEIKEMLLASYAETDKKKAKETAWSILEYDSKNKSALACLAEDSDYFRLITSK